MPTILFILGWRLFFYSNEGKEPMHIHTQKGDMDCKFWIDEEIMDIREEFGFNLTPKARKEIRKIIFQNFDLIVQSWKQYFKN